MATWLRRHDPRMLGGGRQKIGVLVVGLMTALVLYVAGLFVFAAMMPRTVADPTLETDAIVVLTGGSQRLSSAFELMADKRARWLFVSGVNPQTDIASLPGAGLLAPGERSCCVVLGRDADDTIGNAIETAEFAHRHAVRSIRLVTASYHMPRSLLELKRALPEVRIVEHPVFPVGFRQDDWWRWPGSASLVVLEYNKYLAARVRHALADFVMGRAPGPAAP
jgi:uncharacterized SAM-binding protein YcdF (DUF218 family)